MKHANKQIVKIKPLHIQAGLHIVFDSPKTLQFLQILFIKAAYFRFNCYSIVVTRHICIEDHLKSINSIIKNMLHWIGLKTISKLTE